MKKIKLVVLNEHTLGYILPELPNSVQILRQSTLRGAPFRLHETSEQIGSSDKVRLASEADFKVYRVCFDGYKRDCDVYEFLTN